MIKLKYILFSGLFLAFGCFTSCESSKSTEKSGQDIIDINKKTGSMELQYATQFSVDYYADDISIININDGEKYMLIPEDVDTPENIEKDITVIKKPVKNIYMQASSAVDLVNEIDSLENIRAVSTAKKDWYLDEVRNAIDEEKIIYVGKYSSPDYETIISEQCGLAIESTMIYHSPEVKEQLESQGIPVMVERSSYEEHPLGRMEWIKLYGLLLDKEDEANKFFKEKSDMLDDIISNESTGKTAIFFYITSNGYVNVRKPGDYISKMIELAGGEYILKPEDLNVEENALSTMNMQFESFYALAKDADYIIYNSTIDGGFLTLDELIKKNGLLADFKAVKNNNVWCSDKNMFQQTTGTADVIYDLHKIFKDDTDNQKLNFLYKLN